MDNEKAIRILSLRGLEEDYRIWSKKFCSQGIIKGYGGILTRDIEGPAEKKELKPYSIELAARKANTKAYNELILACDDEVGFEIVEQEVTDKHPHGDAREAWKVLKEKYESDDGLLLITLKREFTNCRLESETDCLEAYMIKLEQMRKLLKKSSATVNEMDMILHIISNLPDAYDTTVEICDKKLREGTLNLKELLLKLRMKFKRTNKGQVNQGEKALQMGEDL